MALQDKKRMPHPWLAHREFLLSTGDGVLVEASPYDNIWGIRLAASSPEARDELCRVTQNEMLCDWSIVWQK